MYGILLPLCFNSWPEKQSSFRQHILIMSKSNWSLCQGPDFEEKFVLFWIPLLIPTISVYVAMSRTFGIDHFSIYNSVCPGVCLFDSEGTGVLYMEKYCSKETELCILELFWAFWGQVPGWSTHKCQVITFYTFLAWEDHLCHLQNIHSVVKLSLVPDVGCIELKVKRFLDSSFLLCNYKLWWKGWGLEIISVEGIKGMYRNWCIWPAFSDVINIVLVCYNLTNWNNMNYYKGNRNFGELSTSLNSCERVPSLITFHMLRVTQPYHLPTPIVTEANLWHHLQVLAYECEAYSTNVMSLDLTLYTLVW